MSEILTPVSQVLAPLSPINSALGFMGSEISDGNGIDSFKNIFGFERQRETPFDRNLQGLSDMMMARASGNAPSLAEEQTRQGLDQNLQNTISAIKSAPGMSPALRARLISRAGERAGTETVRQGTEARIAEQIGTERSLANLLLGGRGQSMDAFQDEQNRRNLLKDFARGAGQAAGSGGMGAGK